MPYFTFLLAFLYLSHFPVRTGKKLFSTNMCVLMPNIHKWKKRKLQPPNKPKKLLSSSQNTPVMLNAKLEYKQPEETVKTSPQISLMLQQKFYCLLSSGAVLCLATPAQSLGLPEHPHNICRHLFHTAGMRVLKNKYSKNNLTTNLPAIPSSSTAGDYCSPAADI